MILSDKLFEDVFKKKGHFVFFNVSKDDVNQIKKFLISKDKHFKNCFIDFDEKDERKFDVICASCENEFQRNLLARAYVGTKIMMNLVSNFEVYKNRELYLNCINNTITMESLNNYAIAKNLYKFPTKTEVQNLLKNVPDFDLNIVVLNTKRKLLQQAINDYITADTDLSVKIFTDKNEFNSYKTTAGETISEGDDYFVKSLEWHKPQNDEFIK